MTWSRRASAGTAAELLSVPASSKSLQQASSRRVVVVASVCLVIVMSLTDAVVYADGFVVEPAKSSTSSESFHHRLNDSVKPSWRGLSEWSFLTANDTWDHSVPLISHLNQTTKLYSITRKPICNWHTRATLKIRVTGHSRASTVARNPVTLASAGLSCICCFVLDC